MSTERRKKDGQDPGKKRRRMRVAVAGRQAASSGPKPSTDEVDKVKYKKGSASDRTRLGAP